MAHDWPKILTLFEVMQLSSGYPNHKHIFDAASKELEELEPVPEGQSRRGMYSEHGGSREPTEQPTPGPLTPPQQQSQTGQGVNRRI